MQVTKGVSEGGTEGSAWHADRAFLQEEEIERRHREPQWGRGLVEYGGRERRGREDQLRQAA